MINIKYFKVFEDSSDDKLRITNIDDYITEVLDKYRSDILGYIITEYLSDPNNSYSLYHTSSQRNIIKDGEYRTEPVYSNFIDVGYAPEGCLYAYDIKIDIKNLDENKFDWEAFCSFDLLTGVIYDLKRSLARANPIEVGIQIGNSYDRHYITLSIVTNKKERI